jgi:hypothetical protein
MLEEKKITWLSHGNHIEHHQSIDKQEVAFHVIMERKLLCKVSVGQLINCYMKDHQIVDEEMFFNYKIKQNNKEKNQKN